VRLLSHILRPKQSSSIQIKIKFNQALAGPIQVNQDTSAVGCYNRHHPGSVAAKHTRKRGLTSKKLKDQFEVFFKNPSGIYLPEYCPQDLPWAFNGVST